MSNLRIARRALLGSGAMALMGSLAHASPRRPASRSAAPARPFVMLDPGHGGKDPGAIGYSGTYEKHVAFDTATELARQLNAAGQVQAQLTRQRDIFIPLEDRVGIAQHKGAALFVSMHADSIADHSIRGASVYTLSDTASDAQTAALAQRENSADRFAGPAFHNVSPQVARILASLVQQETRAGSARLSRSVVESLDQNLRMLQNPGRHAAFVVLKAADIPSVLVEMGFMSNPQDEAALRQPAHRAMVASAMKRAVDAYFVSQAVRMAD